MLQYFHIHFTLLTASWFELNFHTLELIKEFFVFLHKFTFPHKFGCLGYQRFPLFSSSIITIMSSKNNKDLRKNRFKIYKNKNFTNRKTTFSKHEPKSQTN